MKAKAVVANRLSGPISDAASRKLDGTASVLPTLHAVRGELDAGDMLPSAVNGSLQALRRAAVPGVADGTTDWHGLDCGARRPIGAGAATTEDDAMSQQEINVIKFRDTVAEIFRPCSELLAKQHASVETYAPPIRHALRDEFGADGARHPVLLYPAVSGPVVDTWACPQGQGKS